MRRRITKASVDALQPGNLLADVDVKGFTARRLPSGVVTYGLRYRLDGKQRWLALGLHGRITPDQARRLAKKRIGEVADNRDPASERKLARAKAMTDATNTVDALLDTFLDRHVRNNLRRAKDVERAFKKYVRPRLGRRSIYDLRRRDIADLLDAIEDGHGPVMADRTLAYLRKAFNWHAARDDDFVPPIVRGMSRTKPTDRARKRILDDDEIRDLWRALDEAELPAPFPRFVRALFLTSQRRDELSRSRWEEIAGNIWIIPAERYKSGLPNVVPLSEEAQCLLGKPLRSGFIFSTTCGAKPFSGFSKAKAALDAQIALLRKRSGRKPMPPWVLHDIRRTARTLMSRAGVSPDIGERVLGHAIPGIRGVYDRHSFLEEKEHALARLAILVTNILSANGGVVVGAEDP